MEFLTPEIVTELGLTEAQVTSIKEKEETMLPTYKKDGTTKRMKTQKVF